MSDAEFKKISTNFHSDSVTAHVQNMVEAGSIVSEFRMNYTVIHGDGVEEQEFVMFLVRHPKIVEVIRELLATLPGRSDKTPRNPYDGTHPKENQ